MKKRNIWLNLLPLAMFLCGCVEETELDEPASLSAQVTAVVQDDCVMLSSDLLKCHKIDNVKEMGFIVKTTFKHPYALKPTIMVYYDTIRLTDELNYKLIDDLTPGGDMEVFAYLHTHTALKYRTSSVSFRPTASTPTTISGVRYYPSSHCDADGTLTIYGQHLTSHLLQVSVTPKSATYGGMTQFHVINGSHDSIQFHYQFYNIGEFQLQADILGKKFDLPEPLRIADASLDGIGTSAYADKPHLMDIQCKSGKVTSMTCAYDSDFIHKLVTRNDLTDDNQWYTIFGGAKGKTYPLWVKYVNVYGYEMHFPPQDITIE